MTRVHAPAVVACVFLVCSLTPAAAAEPAPAASEGAGAGSHPGAPSFDPTGSHPLPNESVEGRPRGTPSGCSCSVASSLGSGRTDALAWGIAPPFVSLRGRKRRRSRRRCR